MFIPVSYLPTLYQGGDERALRNAAEVFAQVMRRITAGISDETSRLVQLRAQYGAFDVNAGYSGGRWHWTPIQAWMFETGAKHPLFGDRSHWYAQPRRPFLEATAVAGYARAEQVYADIEAERLAHEFGYF